MSKISFEMAFEYINSGGKYNHIQSNANNGAVTISARLAPSHASYRGPELV